MARYLYHIPVGSHLILDGRRWKVEARCGDDIDVLSVGDGEFTTLPYERVEQAIRDGQCEVISPCDIEKQEALRRFTGGYTHIDKLDAAEQEAVRERHLLVRAMLCLEEKGEKLTQRHLDDRGTITRIRGHARQILMEADGLTPTRARNRVEQIILPKGRTLQKYLTLYRKFDGNPVALMQRKHMRGPQGEKRSKLTSLQEDFIAYALDHWLKPTKACLASVFRGAIDAFKNFLADQKQLIRFPSITTFRNRIKHVLKAEAVIAREGSRAAKSLIGAGSTDIRAFHLGERVECDESMLSIFCDKSGQYSAKLHRKGKIPAAPEENEVLRTWLHVAIDVASRMPLGWVMSENPSGDHSLALMRMAMRDKLREAERYGCTQKAAPAIKVFDFIMDNGPALRNGRVRAGQLGVGSSVTDCRTYSPMEKPHVERCFGAFEKEVLNFLPGYVGSYPGALPGYDPKAATTLTPDMLYGIITRYMIDEYPLRPHSGVGMFGLTPMQKMQQILESGSKIAPPSLYERRMHLGYSETASVTSEGVKVLGVPYNSSALQRWVSTRSSRNVTAHVDPDFPNVVSLTAEGCTDEIEAHLTMTALADLTLPEMQEVIKRAVEKDTETGQLHDQQLKQARKRRHDESGYFAPVNLPETWARLEDLQRKAEQLLNVEFIPTGSSQNRIGVMERRTPSPAEPIAPTTAPTPSSGPIGPRFGPITKRTL